MLTPGTAFSEEVQEEKQANKEMTITDAVIGLTLNEAFSKFGNPAEVFPIRGESEETDNVVFYYNSHLYLFWYKNRVWQIRADNRFEGKLCGISPQMTFKKVKEILGRPFASDEGSYVFLYTEADYTVKIRVFISDQKVEDIYVYRGDY